MTAADGLASGAVPWVSFLLVLAGMGTWQAIAAGWRMWRRRRPGVRVTRIEGLSTIALDELRPLRAVFVDAQGERWLLVRSSYRHGRDDGRSITLDLVAESEVERRRHIVIDGPGA